ncbi:MAG TPA: PhzF family phenazine biosynthesis protein [Gaiellaceae bacterium]|nr:PhzF family phenazine biosynthesis protein [Gaiellaceae bacterium]
MTALELPPEIGLPADGHRYYVLDVFTDTPLEGNQLGVFADGRAFTDEQMQRLARELNVAETIFVLPPEQGGDARIRIFTPASELPFAGHPVLGASFVVGGALGLDEVRLETALRVVPLRLERAGGRVVFGWMEQAVAPWQRYERADELLAALGLERSLLPVEVYENGPRHVFVCLESEEAVAALSPDLGALATHARVGANCFAGSGKGWKTRMFAPSIGVPEDPATGSAAGPLAMHLGRHGLVPFGERIEIRQGVEMLRPSLLHACAHGTADRIDRVEVGGSAVIVARGEYRV